MAISTDLKRQMAIYAKYSSQICKVQISSCLRNLKYTFKSVLIAILIIELLWPFRRMAINTDLK